MEETVPISILSRNTLIPAGAVLAIAITIISAWGYLDSRFSAIMKSLERQDRRLEQLERISGERVSSVDMKLWISEFRRLNPKMEIPEFKPN